MTINKSSTRPQAIQTNNILETDHSHQKRTKEINLFTTLQNDSMTLILCKGQ